MGAKVWNVMQVMDWRTEEHFVRLHLDIPLDASVSGTFRDALGSGDIQGAINLLRKAAPTETHESIEAVFGAFRHAPKGPAPWYKFRSKVDGKTYCLQTKPGPGWERVDGPFKDSHCTIRAKDAEE